MQAFIEPNENQSINILKFSKLPILLYCRKIKYVIKAGAQFKPNCKRGRNKIKL